MSNVDLQVGFVREVFREADLQIHMLDGQIYADFARQKASLKLIRISFDGFGCCNPKKISSMDSDDSKFMCGLFDSNENLSSDNADKLNSIILKYLRQNHSQLWDDALVEYKIIS